MKLGMWLWCLEGISGKWKWNLPAFTNTGIRWRW